LTHLSACADHLANGVVSPALEIQQGSSALESRKQQAPADVQIDEDASVFRLWWPLLLGVSGHVSDHRLAVRARALETLGIVLRNYGHLFSPQTWGVIFRGVLFPIIDSAKTDSTYQLESKYPTENPAAIINNNSWIGTMAMSAFAVCVDLFLMFRVQVEEVQLLPDLLTLVEDCVCQDIETLSRMSMKVFGDLVVALGKDGDDRTKHLSARTVQLLCDRLCRCIHKNLTLDFGTSVGVLEFALESPSTVAETVPECPLIVRRRLKSPSAYRVKSGSHHDLGDYVVTPFGGGQIVQVLHSPH
jgi:hypothetical protein